MNIRLLTLSALAAAGVIAAAGTTEVSVAAQMKQPVQAQNPAQKMSNTPKNDQLTYGLGTNQTIGCKAGRIMVVKHGFRHVRTVECMGSSFTYLGQRHGHNYKIKLSSHTGQITRIKRA